jgi:hypothetical protein
LRVPLHNAGNLGVPCPADEEMCDRNILIPGKKVYALVSGLLVRVKPVTDAVIGTHPLAEQIDISRLDGNDANVCSFTLHVGELMFGELTDYGMSVLQIIIQPVERHIIGTTQKTT